MTNATDIAIDSSATQDETLRVEIHTGEYIALGAIVTRHQRLMDVLENLTSPYLRLECARVQFLEQGNGPQVMETLLVARDHIRIAIPYEEEAAPGARKSHPRYVPKYPVAASLYMDRMQIEGNLHIREGEEAVVAAQNLSDAFIAITAAWVRYLDQARSLPFHCPVVVVNRRFVNLIALRPQPREQARSRLEKLLTNPSSLAARMLRTSSLSA